MSFNKKGFYQVFIFPCEFGKMFRSICSVEHMRKNVFEDKNVVKDNDQHIDNLILGFFF